MYDLLSKTKPQREINMLAGVGKRFYGEMFYFEGDMNFKARPPSASQPKIRCKGQGLIVANATKRYDKTATISPERAIFTIKNNKFYNKVFLKYLLLL